MAAADMLDSVILEIENDRLDRRIELIKEAKTQYSGKSQADFAKDLQKIMNTRIQPEDSEEKYTVVPNKQFDQRQLKYGITVFTINKIIDFIENNKFKKIDSEKIRNSFIKIFETLNVLIQENEGDPDYANFVNDVLFMFYNCSEDVIKLIGNDQNLAKQRVDASLQEAVLAFEIFSKKMNQRDNLQQYTSRSGSSISSGSSVSTIMTIESIRSNAFSVFYDQVPKNDSKPIILKPIKVISVEQNGVKHFLMVSDGSDGETNHESVGSSDSKSLKKIGSTDEIVSTKSSVESVSEKSLVKSVSEKSLEKLILTDSVLNHVHSDSTFNKVNQSGSIEPSYVKAMHAGFIVSQLLSDVKESSRDGSSTVRSDESSENLQSAATSLKEQIFEKYTELSVLQDEYDNTDVESKSADKSSGQASKSFQPQTTIVPKLTFDYLKTYASGLTKLPQINLIQSSLEPSSAASARSEMSDITMSSFDDYFVGALDDFHKPQDFDKKKLQSVTNNHTVESQNEGADVSVDESDAEIAEDEKAAETAAETAAITLLTDNSLKGLIHRTENDFLTIVTQDYIDTNEIDTNEIKIVDKKFPATTYKFFIGYLKKNDKTKVWESHLRVDDFDDYRHLRSSGILDSELKHNLRIIYESFKNKYVESNKIKLTQKDLNFDTTDCGRSGNPGQKEKACANAETNAYKIFEKTMEEYIQKSNGKLKKEDIHSILYLLVVEKVDKSKSKKGQNPSNFTIIPFHAPNLI